VGPAALASLAVVKEEEMNSSLAANYVEHKSEMPSGGIPSEVFASEHSLKLNGSSIGLKYYGPAHTDSDISVTFTEANIVHVGDTFWNGGPIRSSII
jgi:hypothetical protein